MPFFLKSEDITIECGQMGGERSPSLAHWRFKDLACIPAVEILRVRSRAGRLVSGITVKRYDVIIGFG